MTGTTHIAAQLVSSVLIIEDNEDLREGIRLVLENAGCSAIGVGDAFEAFAYLSRERPPSAILLDLSLPFIDGATFRRMLSNDPRWADIPVIVCTADCDAVARPRILGIERWLRKPCSAGAIVDAVHPYCAAS
jgi:CheY-like chemotaxis protein